MQIGQRLDRLVLAAVALTFAVLGGYAEEHGASTTRRSAPAPCSSA